MMTASEKTKAVGRAVTQLERELMDAGEHIAADKLIALFATISEGGMARFYDLLTSCETKQEAIDQLSEEADMDMKKLLASMKPQGDEFDACQALCKQMRRIEMTPIVDDDYPSVRRDYEDAVRVFLRACKANGRTL